MSPFVLVLALGVSVCFTLHVSARNLKRYWLGSPCYQCQQDREIGWSSRHRKPGRGEQGTVLRIVKVFAIVAFALLFAVPIVGQQTPQGGDGRAPAAKTNGQPAESAGTMGNLEVLTDTQGLDFGPYLSKVVEAVRRNWYTLIPAEARLPELKSGKLAIEFSILHDGRIAAMKLVSPSGDVALDRAAWGGISASNPFAPLPAEYTRPYLALRFRFYYNTKKGELPGNDGLKSVPDNPDLIAADQLYKAGKFAEAADKYQALLKIDPKLVPAEAGLIHALLHQQKIDEASAEAEKALGAQPNSAALLAAMGDVQFRLAQMTDAETSYRKALQADPRELRAYLGLARLYRAYSLYRHAYDALKVAYQIAPSDPEVRGLWFNRLSRRESIAAIEAYLAGPHPDDPEQTEYLQHYLAFLKATVDKPVHACRLVSKVQQTDTKLQRMLPDPRHIVGYGLEVKLNDRSSRLLLDTGASGILIGRKGAEKAGLTRISDIRFRGIGDKGLQGGYLAVADHIRIGELEFADCVVTVTDRATILDEDGLIGANVFASYLIDIDFPAEKLRLLPLPKRPDETVAPTALNSEGESHSNPDDNAEGAGDQKAESTGDVSKTATVAPDARLPKDRYIAPEMKSWTPVFHVGHQLLIRTEVNDSKPMLFLIDTGTGANLLSTRAGREVTKVRSDPSTHVKGLSGTVADVYSADKATLRFGRFAQKNLDIMSLDLSNISKSTGTEVSGILGFQLLRILQVKIDYRDGLVDFAYDASRWH